MEGKKENGKVSDIDSFPGASDTLTGTSWLVKGLVSAADHHLEVFAQHADGQRHRCWPVVQHIRLELPGADGFESLRGDQAGPGSNLNQQANGWGELRW